MVKIIISILKLSRLPSVRLQKLLTGHFCFFDSAEGVDDGDERQHGNKSESS